MIREVLVSFLLTYTNVEAQQALSVSLLSTWQRLVFLYLEH